MAAGGVAAALGGSALVLCAHPYDGMPSFLLGGLEEKAPGALLRLISRLNEASTNQKPTIQAFTPGCQGAGHGRAAGTAGEPTLARTTARASDASPSHLARWAPCPA